MKWKHPFLDQAYHLATGAAPDVAEAELMFKIDFHEYYGMLERALVHLQLVFGIVISGQHRDLGRLAPAGEGREPPAAASAGATGAGAAGDRPRRYAHSYHANVLAALDNPTNPLHGTLGSLDVRRALSRAKDLRNRWAKDENHQQQHRRARRGRGRQGTGLGDTPTATMRTSWQPWTTPRTRSTAPWAASTCGEP